MSKTGWWRGWLVQCTVMIPVDAEVTGAKQCGWSSVMIPVDAVVKVLSKTVVYMLVMPSVDVVVTVHSKTGVQAGNDLC